MTAALVVLVIVLGIAAICGLSLIGAGLLDRDGTWIIVGAGTVIVACAALAGIAYHDSGPACTLRPSSLVEATTP